MMMECEDIVAEGPDSENQSQASLLRHHDGTSRRVVATGIETPCPDGKLIVSRTDLQGLITHINPAFVEMSGYSRDELIGQAHHVLRHPDMPAATYAELWATVARGEAWNGYLKNLRKDGGHYWVYATVIPNLRSGLIVGYTSVRRRPSPSRVRACAAEYRQLRMQELAA